jgi:hypothetical protein
MKVGGSTLWLLRVDLNLQLLGICDFAQCLLPKTKNVLTSVVRTNAPRRFTSCTLEDALHSPIRILPRCKATARARFVTFLGTGLWCNRIVPVGDIVARTIS